MFALLVATVLSAALCADAALPKLEDDCLVKFVEQVIEDAGRNLAIAHLDELQLPIFGIFPWDPVKLRNGLLGNFSTMELKAVPVVDQHNNTDRSTTLYFDIVLGLNQASIHYDFKVNILGLYTKEGVLSLAIHNNTVNLKGTLVFYEDGKCDTTLFNADVKELDGFDIDVQPDDLPNLTEINEAILNFLVPKMLPLANEVVNKVIATGIFRQAYSDLVCKQLINNSTIDS